VGVAIIINQQACPQWAVIGKPRLVGGRAARCAVSRSFPHLQTASVGGPARPQTQSRFSISTPPNFPPLFFARLL